MKEICGYFSRCCYKAYDCKKHADEFVETGSFRLGSVSYYENLGDSKRGDPTEGHALTREPGIISVGLVSPNRNDPTIWTRQNGYVQHEVETTNPVFCFCTFLPRASLVHISKTYGKYIVKISEPRKLAEEIRDYLCAEGRNSLVMGSKVVYNKGQELKRQLTVIKRADLSYTQKPFAGDGKEYYKDREFRFVVIDFEGSQDEAQEFIQVRLGKRLNYLSPVRSED